jgi:thiamine biosynthesis lipoprotein
MRLPMIRFMAQVVALCTVLPACTPGVEVTVLGGSTMATSYAVRLADPVANREGLGRQIQVRLDEIDNRMSTYIAESDVTRFNNSDSTDWFPVARSTCEVVALSLSVSALTEGAFDITVGPLVNLWGFGPDGQIDEPPAPDLLAAAREVTGYEAVSTDCRQPALRKSRAGIRIDLSAVAKGYAVDVLADALEAEGYRNYLVEVGGEMRIAGTKPDGEGWRVGIEAPVREHRDVYDALAVTDTAVASSGDYRNYVEIDGRYYSHTIDPRTGAPVTHATGGVTVLAATAGYADAMATALLVLGAEDGLELAERENIAALFLTRTAGDVSATVSSRFDARRRGPETSREIP